MQIPCLNEEQTLPAVLDSIPTAIPGIDEIIVLVIDDGSTDRTVEVAREHGVTHFVRHAGNRGLGRSFHDGVQRALELGADIVVNTDGDNQYPQDRIPDLVAPILAGTADLVIADRQVHLVEHFSRGKVLLQHLGSRVVSRVAGVRVVDAASGFRAYSRDSLMLLNTITRFSYTMETLIQAGNKRLRVETVPVRTNAKTRDSRLFRSSTQHVRMSAAAIMRGYIMYRPLTLFLLLATVLGVLGLVPMVRWVILQILSEDPGGHLQSLLLGAVLLIMAFLCCIVAIVADLIRTNRGLIEDSLEHTKKMRFGRGDGLVQLPLAVLDEVDGISPARAVPTSGPDTATSGSDRTSVVR